ncbi:MAG: hypothetical protein WBM27_00170 [bacterium]
MRKVTFCSIAFLLLLTYRVNSADCWPVYDYPQFTDPTPGPGNTGTGVLNIESVVPNIKNISPLQPNETWTITCVDAPDYKFKLSSNLVGDDGFFFSSDKFRSNSGKMVLVPYPFGSADAKIVDGNPNKDDTFEFTLLNVNPSNDRVQISLQFGFTKEPS